MDIIRLVEGAIDAHSLFNPPQTPNFNVYKARVPALNDRHLIGLFRGYTFFANRLSPLNARNSKVCTVEPSHLENLGWTLDALIHKHVSD